MANGATQLAFAACICVAGQVIFGAVTSFTATWKVQVRVRLAASVTDIVTVVLPVIVVPEAGVWVIADIPGQLSEAEVEAI